MEYLHKLITGPEVDLRQLRLVRGVLTVVRAVAVSAISKPNVVHIRVGLESIQLTLREKKT